MREWQPIETAPKDGTEILLYQPALKYITVDVDPMIYVCKWRSFDREVQGRTGEFIEAHGEQYMNMPYATHWMPLPEPPNA